MATSDNSGAFLEDLANEILLSLPVKSLLRFKCVSKKWCALIEDPKFTIEHLICSKKKPPQFLIYDYGAPQDAPPVTVIFDNGIPSPSQGDNSQRFGAIKTLLGSVDGLFFLEREIDNGLDKGSLCSLWNPATREVRHLPAATIEFQPFDDSGRHFGFGLDPMTKDYKVIYHYLRDECAAVYSCSRDSWKIFKHDVNYNYRDCERNVLYNNTYLNGSYYWLLTEDPTWKIISFDFGKEMFVEIKGPPDDYYIDVWSANLILFDDSVAILNFLEGRVIDVWVMIHPGVWNKFVTFNWFEPIEICYESSLILVTKDSRLLSYNVKTKKTKLLEFHLPGTSSTDPEIGGCGIYYYKESLVTIKRQESGELDLSGCLTKMVAGY